MIDQLNELRYGGTGSMLRGAVNFIMENPQYVLGAIGAAAIYVGVTVATGGAAGGAAAPLIFSENVLTIGGISGAVTGITYNEYTRNKIKKQLEQEYGVNVEEIQLYAMDKMPEAAVKLCEEYEDLDRRNQLYVDTTTKLAEMALLLYISDGVYRTGATLATFMANKEGVDSNIYATYAENATKNPNSSEVVLGKFNQEGISYVKVAEQRGATYFQLDNWEDAVKAVGENNIWNINEQFLSQQIEQGKQIVLSHNPNDATGYYAQEVQFLIKKGYDFVKSGNIWKAVLR